uniref:Uncharacterized protein n=1 Tax=Cacopsylla melanoneura TaxID=428564 RepID=A0A8D8UJQ1_9HEMI
MIDWYGTAGILVFYSIILGVGVWAGTKKKNNGEEEVMLAHFNSNMGRRSLLHRNRRVILHNRSAMVSDAIRLQFQSGSGGTPVCQANERSWIHHNAGPVPGEIRESNRRSLVPAGFHGRYTHPRCYS